MSSADDLLKSMEVSATVVELYTGYRNSFIAAGWSPQGAEQMVIEMVRATAAKS